MEKFLFGTARALGSIGVDPLRPRFLGDAVVDALAELADKTGRVRFLSPAEETSLRKALEDREERLREARSSFNEWRVDRGMKALPGIKRSRELLLNYQS